MYCTFSLRNKTAAKLKGIYSYCVNEALMYISRCRDNFGNGLIWGMAGFPQKTCYIDGQATNCHLNQLINQNVESTQFFYYNLTDDIENARIEEALIKIYKPEWNIALKEK